ncbi:MAG TPA: YeeE/YedE family protein [Alphaproteobacteria bacterium]|nr:YeeE/YedE family protein [Alphaproteobacteria bacterium]
MTMLVPFFAGFVFGAGLVVSQMVDPAKVLGFLDIAGAWDPSLALVMVGALAVTAIGYRVTFHHGRPLAAERFQLPTRTDIDPPLVVGAALFGLGWGMAGYCPGPAIASLAFGQTEIVVFVLAMLAGMATYRFTGDRPVSGRYPQSAD